MSYRPALLQHRRYIRNGMYPSTQFYAQAVTRENHLLALRKKEVYSWSGRIGSAAIDGGTHRFHCHTGYGTTRLVAYAIIGPPEATGDEPYVTITVTIPAGATSTFAPDMHGPGPGSTAAGDAPDNWTYHRSEVTVTANQTYEGLVTAADHCRIMSLTIYEEADGDVDDTINYYNEFTPQVGAKIYDAYRQRLLQGMSNMWGRNGGLAIHWSLEGGTSRTRTSATAINLIDDTETGTPTANSAGWKLDLGSRTTVSRIVVPCRLAVYGSMASGSGTVRLIDTGGATLGSITINSATPQWWTASANLVASTAKFYAPQYAGDGTNLLSISALSIYEYE
jgi:hypothetical protein